jgi:hypothetical protein
MKVGPDELHESFIEILSESTPAGSSLNVKELGSKEAST